MHFSNNMFCLAVLSAFRSLKNDAVSYTCCTTQMTFKSTSAQNFIAEGVSLVISEKTWPVMEWMVSACTTGTDCFRTMVKADLTIFTDHHLSCKSVVLQYLGDVWALKGQSAISGKR